MEFLENTSIWILLLPVVVAILSWLWLLFARIKGWDKDIDTDVPNGPDMDSLDDTEEAEESRSVESTSNESSSIPWYQALWQDKWSLALILLILAGAAYMLIFAPPRMGGEIPIYPNQPGRPFFNFHWQRDYLNGKDNHIAFAISIFGSVTGLLALAWGQWRRKRFGGEVGLLLAGMAIAGLGQWALLYATYGMGVAFYGFAIVVFISWLWMARKRLPGYMETSTPWPLFLNWLIPLAIFVLAAFARFYALESVPYGVEGDESKWIFEVVELMLDGDYESSGEYHRDALPGSFYMQTIFQNWLGVGIHSARVGVVIYSLLGTLAFYWLLKQIAPGWLATLGAFFLSISVMDISASRLANVESHVKFWPILAFALLALSIKQRRWQVYSLSGLALALGLLTYDTVLPILLVLFILVIVELLVERVDLKSAAMNLAAFLLPSLFTIPLLVPYFTSRLTYYEIGDKGWNEDLWLTLWTNLKDVAQSWFVDTRFDFIYNRQGPILNAILLPFLVFGVVVAFGTLRQRVSRWILLWMLLVIIPVPVLASSPFGRVYYPGLPAVYALIALGMFLLIKETMRLLGPALRPLGMIFVIAVLAWLPLYNLYLYFNAVGDPGDRQIRREIGEYALSAAQTGSHLYMPFWPIAKDPLFIEWQIAELYLRQEVGADQIDESYDRVALNEFLPYITAHADDWEQIDILLDKDTSTQRDQWNAMQTALFQCFPGGSLKVGHYFDRYRLDASLLKQPTCTPVSLQLNWFDEDEDSNNLSWALSSGTIDAIRLRCEQEKEDVIWVEAENFEWGPGWGEDVAFVTGWQGGGYLVDSYGSQVAAYRSTLAGADQAFAWVRSYKRAVDEAPAYLELGNQSFSFADVQEGGEYRWIWERLGPFDIPEGEQNWRITRPYEQPAVEFMALFIDTVIFTTNPDYTPEDGVSREIAYNQVLSLSKAAQKGIINLTLPEGRYFCSVGLEPNGSLVDAYGQTEVWSESLEIEIP